MLIEGVGLECAGTAVDGVWGRMQPSRASLDLGIT